MIAISKETCTGCSSCVQICPCACIRVLEDSEGFLYPQIDESRCIHCGQCEVACPVIANACVATDKTPIAYAIFAVDSQIRHNSSSGGMFNLLATKVIGCGGIVFGVGFDEKWQVCHMAVDRTEELPKLMTSKYVQSNIGTAYHDVQRFLQAGRLVYFSGTPCQTMGLRNYLRIEYSNLILQDIICHGVPSPKVWRKYLLESFHGKNILSVSFRDKTEGWNQFGMKIVMKEGSYQKTGAEDPFIKAFLGNVCLRPSCHYCRFKTINRASDITLADFWGVEMLMPKQKDDKGVSLVLTHTEKGQCLVEGCANEANMKQVDVHQALRYNHAAEHSVLAHAKRAYFFQHLDTLPFKTLIRRSFRQNALMCIKKMIRRGSRKLCTLGLRYEKQLMSKKEV